MVGSDSAIKTGAHVYGRRGGHVGVVEAADAEELRVRGDGPMSRVFYVPVEAVVGMMPGGREIFLDCLREDLDALAWQHPRREHAAR